MADNSTKSRGPIAAMFTGPGPAVCLPTLVGQSGHDPRSEKKRAPAYGFGQKHGKLHNDDSPGPTHCPEPKVYRDGMDGTPHYSIYGKPKDWNRFLTPGPGAYSPEAAGASSRCSPPRYSFGLRTKNKERDNAPAPNTYAPPVVGKLSKERNAPKVSLAGRPKTNVGSFAEDLAKSPGAGTYKTTEADVYKNKRPLYSMTGRNHMPGEKTQKPGPGAYSPEKVPSQCRATPRFSFGIRHSAYEAPLIINCDDQV